MSQSDLEYVTLDWDVIPEDPMFREFHDMFTHFYDNNTSELLDGEAIGTDPIEIKCIPNGLTVFAPPVSKQVS